MSVYVVRKNDELDTEIYVFEDYDVAHEAADVLDGYVNEEPILDAEFVRQAREVSP